jgi:hypothetical protein
MQESSEFCSSSCRLLTTFCVADFSTPHHSFIACGSAFCPFRAFMPASKSAAHSSPTILASSCWEIISSFALFPTPVAMSPKTALMFLSVSSFTPLTVLSRCHSLGIIRWKSFPHPISGTNASERFGIFLPILASVKANSRAVSNATMVLAVK